MIGGLALSTLRLHRAQTVATALLLAVLSATLIVDGRSVASLVADYQDGCRPPDCAALVGTIDRHLNLLGQFLAVLGLLPAAIGAFWGAPSVGREYETGTIQLAFTQSVSRLRWITTRVGSLAAVVAVGGAVLGVVVDDWLAGFATLPLPAAVEAQSGFGNIRGATPVGWWLLGFAVGALCGALLRRTVAAMAVTVVLVTLAVASRTVLVVWLGPGQVRDDGTRVLVEVASTAGLATLLLAATCWVVTHRQA